MTDLDEMSMSELTAASLATSKEIDEVCARAARHAFGEGWLIETDDTFILDVREVELDKIADDCALAEIHAVHARKYVAYSDRAVEMMIGSGQFSDDAIQQVLANNKERKEYLESVLEVEALSQRAVVVAKAQLAGEAPPGCDPTDG